MKSNEEILESAILRVAYANDSMSGCTENEDVDYREFCIYAHEQFQLDEYLDFAKECFGVEIKYEVTETFEDGNGDECIYLKSIE